MQPLIILFVTVCVVGLTAGQLADSDWLRWKKDPSNESGDDLEKRASKTRGWYYDNSVRLRRAAPAEMINEMLEAAKRMPYSMPQYWSQRVRQMPRVVKVNP